VKLILVALFLAALIPHRATAAGVTVNVQAVVFIAMLTVAAAGLCFALRPSARQRIYLNGYAHA
jgi:hypothetical protein